MMSKVFFIIAFVAHFYNSTPNLESTPLVVTKNAEGVSVSLNGYSSRLSLEVEWQLDSADDTVIPGSMEEITELSKDKLWSCNFPLGKNYISFVNFDENCNCSGLYVTEKVLKHFLIILRSISNMLATDEDLNAIRLEMAGEENELFQTKSLQKIKIFLDELLCGHQIGGVMVFFKYISEEAFYDFQEPHALRYPSLYLN